MHKKSGGIIINPGCGLACVFCGGHKKITNDQIRKEEVNAYRNLQDFERGGMERIIISGCDPIEYDKIIELSQYIKSRGFKSIHLSTHGTKLADPSFFNRFIKSGINELRMPIYGSNAKVHDSVTQTPGSFNKIVTVVKKLLREVPAPKIQISCLVVEQNKENLLNVVDFVNGLGIKDFYFSIPCLVGLANNDYSFYVPSKNLPPYIRKLYKYTMKVNESINFLEIPFCVFGELNLKNIDNQCSPPNLGKYNQPPEAVRTSIPNLPSYRLKKRVAICRSCRARNYCDGFFVNDIDKFGIGKLRKL